MIIPIFFNILALIILLCAGIVYGIVLLTRKLKEYGKQGRLQRKIIIYLFLVVFGNFIFYLLDIHQYFYSRSGVHFYPHMFLPFNSYVDRWDHEGYYLFPTEIFSQKCSKTQCIRTGCGGAFSTYVVHDSIWEHHAVYQSLLCTNYDKDTVTIPMKTILSYAFNRTDFIMQVQDTIGQQYWIRVIPDAFQHYQIPSDKPYNKDMQSYLTLKYRYMLLSEDDISKEYYHWIDLYSKSLGLNICHSILDLLWFVLILVFLPIVRLLLLINLIRLAYQRYKQHHKPNQLGSLE